MVEEVELGTVSRTLYERLKKQIEVEIQELIDDAEDRNISPSIVLSSVLKVTLRLTQVTSGYTVTDNVYDDAGNLLQEGQTIILDDQPKAVWLREHLQTLGPNDKAIIWVNWTPEYGIVGQALQDIGYDYVTYRGDTSDPQRDKAVARFNGDPDCRVFLGNPKAGGVGINLLGYQHPDQPTNTSHMVYYSRDYSSLAREQSEDRANRKGSRVPLQIVDLLAANTIDAKILADVQAKIDNALSLQDVSSLMRRLVFDPSGE